MSTNWSAVAAHAEALGYGDGRVITLALFPPRGHQGISGSLYFQWDPTTGSCTAVDTALTAHPRYSLGLIPNPGGTKNADITEAVALFFEDDGPAGLDEKLLQWRLAGLPQPCLQITTGGKSVHNYWRLVTPCTPQEFRAAQTAIFNHVQARLPNAQIDTSLAKPCQVLRAAGGIHPDTGRTSAIINNTGELHRIEDILKCCTETPQRVVELPPTGASGEGVPFEQRTLADKAAVMVEALRYVPQREEPGSGTYPAAFGVVCALVHEFGVDGAYDICVKAQWSLEHWNLAAEMARALTPPDPTTRKRVWSVFDTAIANGWTCPWPRERTRVYTAEQQQRLEEVDEIVRELQREEMEAHLSASADTLTLADVLHPRLASIIATRAKAFPVDELMCLGPLMASTAAVLGTRYRVAVTDSHSEPMVFWIGTVASSSSLKTPVTNQMLHALKKMDGDAVMNYQQEYKAYKAGSKEDKPAAPELPRRFVAVDATMEGLCSLQAQPNIHGMICANDELSSFFAGLDAYRNGQGKDRGAWLSMWSGGEVNIIRKGSEPIYVSQTAVSLFGNIQPDMLSELVGKDKLAEKSGDGFWGRFLWVVPRHLPLVNSRHTANINAELYDLAQCLNTVRVGQVVRLSDEAWELWSTISQGWTNSREDCLPAFSAFLGKMPGYLARIAGWLHAIDFACNHCYEVPMDQISAEVSADTMARAIRLSRFFVNQFSRILPEIGIGYVATQHARIIAMAKRSPTNQVSVRDMIRARIATTSQEARNILNELVQTYGLGTLKRGRTVKSVLWEYKID